jgi:branched-chain amino acid transport system ATP-binding protein
MNGAPLLDVRALRKRFGGLLATDDVTLDVRAGEVHALIGPNGAGKSTLIGQLTGELHPDAGEIHFDGARIDKLSAHARVRLGLARTFQITQLLPAYSALENVAIAVDQSQGAKRARAAARTLAYAQLEESGLADRATTRVDAMSQGERKQLELAAALAMRPRLALLDEPMAGLGRSESVAMIDRLGQLKGKVAMLLVEHDLDAVFALADRISVLVYGRIVVTGTPDEIRGNKDVQTAYLGEGDV